MEWVNLVVVGSKAEKDYQYYFQDSDMIPMEEEDDVVCGFLLPVYLFIIIVKMM